MRACSNACVVQPDGADQRCNICRRRRQRHPGRGHTRLPGLGYSREELLALDMFQLSSTFPDVATWRASARRCRPRPVLPGSPPAPTRRQRPADADQCPHDRADDHEYVVAPPRDLSRIREQDAQLRLQIHALNAAATPSSSPTPCAHPLGQCRLHCSPLYPERSRRPTPPNCSSRATGSAYYQRMWDTILAARSGMRTVNKRRDGSLYDEDMTSPRFPWMTRRSPTSSPSAGHQRAQAARGVAGKRTALPSALRTRPVAYQSLDAEGRILEVNDAWLAQLATRASRDRPGHRRISGAGRRNCSRIA